MEGKDDEDGGGRREGPVSKLVLKLHHWVLLGVLSLPLSVGHATLRLARAFSLLKRYPISLVECDAGLTF